MSIYSDGSVQDFSVEVSTAILLKKFLSLGMSTILNSLEKIKIEIVDRKRDNFELYLPSETKNLFPIIIISGWYDDNNQEKEIDIIERNIQNIKEIIRTNLTEWTAQFVSKFGHEGKFKGMDGCVRIGFKIIACNETPRKLAICLTHIHYGK